MFYFFSLCDGGANKQVMLISVRESRPAGPHYKRSFNIPLHRAICHGNECLVT